MFLLSPTLADQLSLCNTALGAAFTVLDAAFGVHAHSVPSASPGADVSILASEHFLNPVLPKMKYLDVIQVGMLKADTSEVAGIVLDGS